MPFRGFRMLLYASRPVAELLTELLTCRLASVVLHQPFLLLLYSRSSSCCSLRLLLKYRKSATVYLQKYVVEKFV